MITQKSRKLLLLRNSKIRVKKQFGGYPGTYLLVPGYKNLSSRRRDIQILVGLGRTVEKIKIWNLVRVWWIRNPSVQLCRVYRKPKIWSPGWKLIPKKISQLIPNACYVQFQARPAELSISKGFWIFFVKSLSRKIIPWTFVKFRCYYLSTYYLEVLEMCRESLSCVFAIMVEKFKFPAVGYLPWPLPILQKIQIQKLHTKSRKNPRNCYYNLLSPPLVWFFVISR